MHSAASSDAMRGSHGISAAAAATGPYLPPQVALQQQVKVTPPSKKMNPFRNASFAMGEIFHWDEPPTERYARAEPQPQPQPQNSIPQAGFQQVASQHGRAAYPYPTQQYAVTPTQGVVTGLYYPPHRLPDEPTVVDSWSQTYSNSVATRQPDFPQTGHASIPVTHHPPSPPLPVEQTLTYTHTGTRLHPHHAPYDATQSQYPEEAAYAKSNAQTSVPVAWDAPTFAAPVAPQVAAAPAANANVTSTEPTYAPPHSVSQQTRGFEQDLSDADGQSTQASQESGVESEALDSDFESRPRSASSGAKGTSARRAVARAHDSRKAQATADEDRIERSLIQHMARNGAATHLDVDNSLKDDKSAKGKVKKYTDAELAELERADPLLYLKVKKLLSLHEVALTTRDVRENQERLAARADERRRRLKAAQLLREIRQRKRAEAQLAAAAKRSGASAGACAVAPTTEGGGGSKLVLSESSRLMPDSFVAKQLHRPVFHNYGVGAKKILVNKPGVAHMLTHNVTPEQPPNKSPARQVYATARRAWRHRVRSELEDERCLQQMLEPALLKASARVHAEKREREAAKLANAVKSRDAPEAPVSRSSKPSLTTEVAQPATIGVSDPSSHFVALSKPALHSAAASYVPAPSQIVRPIPATPAVPECSSTTVAPSSRSAISQPEPVSHSHPQHPKPVAKSQPTIHAHEPAATPSTQAPIARARTQREAPGATTPEAKSAARLQRPQTATIPSQMSAEEAHHRALHKPGSPRRLSADIHVKFNEKVDVKEIEPATDLQQIQTQAPGAPAPAVVPTYTPAPGSAAGYQVASGPQSCDSAPHPTHASQQSLSSQPQPGHFPGTAWYANPYATLAPKQLMQMQFHTPTPFATHEGLDFDETNTPRKRRTEAKIRPEEMVIPAGISSISMPAIREREARYISEASDICAIHSSARSAIINYYTRK